MKILLVDDDLDMLDITSYALRREGFNVIVATNGLEAIQRWTEDQPNVVVLDAKLPRMTGFEVCRRIRQTSTTPIIMLTALHDEEHIVSAFRMGADDYVTKPFSPRQLALRIRAVARRSGRDSGIETMRKLNVAGMTFDPEAHEVQVHDQVVRLTPIEFRLIYILASNPGRVISMERLVEYAWGYDRGDTSLLKSHISHIRKKLKLQRNQQGDISTLPGVGYRLLS